MAGPAVGIFFRIGEAWIVDAVAVRDGDAYGDAVQHGGHHDYWEALLPRTRAERSFKAHDYDYYPRGRVVYYPTAQTYRVYVDNCLTAAERREVLAAFGLTAESVEVEGNDDGTHYVCARCSPGYLE